jgi:hypothetical protein
MRKVVLLLAALVAATSVEAFHAGPSLPTLAGQRRVALLAQGPRVAGVSLMRMADGSTDEAAPKEEAVEAKEGDAGATPKSGSQMYKIKVDKSGAGFNQFDPVRLPSRGGAPA